jgi:sRNA-binding protein
VPAASTRATQRKPSALRIGIERRMSLMRDEWVARFPKCFVPVGTEPRPLMIGVTHAIFSAAPELSAHDVTNTIAAYCDDPRYHAAIVASTDRIDLDGNAVGFVSARAKAHAGRRIREIAVSVDQPPREERAANEHPNQNLH